MGGARDGQVGRTRGSSQASLVKLLPPPGGTGKITFRDEPSEDHDDPWKHGESKHQTELKWHKEVKKDELEDMNINQVLGLQAPNPPSPPPFQPPKQHPDTMYTK